jgi:transcriptional regulator GlxA family with amidase domain
MIRVEVLTLSGAMPSSVAITIDVLATANRLRVLAGRAEAFAAQFSGSGAKGARKIAAAAGLESQQDYPAEVVVMPGLGLSNEAELAARFARPDVQRARKSLLAAAARGAEIATSCSGVFLLASTGLLDGRRATTTWWLAPVFRRMYPAVELDPDALVVCDVQVTTAGAAMAQMDLMLAVVTQHAGARLADQCARYLLLDQRRSQSRYIALGFLAAADPQIAKAEAWARARLDRAFTVDDVARAAGLAPRTFARRTESATGQSPVRFLQRLRVDAAIELIETTRLPFEEIARRVGYAEPSTLRRLLQRTAGQGPRGLRNGSAERQINGKKPTIGATFDPGITSWVSRSPETKPPPRGRAPRNGPP